MNIVIIGAGVAGLSIGWRLLQAGASVTILERAQPGMGATWASAGMIALTAELDESGAAEVTLAREANRLWPDFAAELEAAAGGGIGFCRAGTLLLAADAAGLDALRARGPVLDGAGARALVPLLGADAVGGLWTADEARVDNRLLAEALTIAFLKAGGTLRRNEAVIAIEHRDGKAASVLTASGRGRIPGDAFVLAAGAWSGLLDDLPVTPVKGEMIALEAPEGARPPEPVVWGAKDGQGVYLVPRGNRLLVGATMQEAGFDTSLSAAARAHLRGRAESLMPDLRRWRLVEHWAGLRPRSADGLPLLGPSRSPNLFVAGGQFRNGILFAPAIARHMADLVQGRATVIPEFDPRRFQKD
ncbi:MAG: glycine oxidase ThiO [Alphaproteobacteria bacterium 65-7]|nr:MAG: glycine oxidase ThiO [Alphaproteobacteria bacterium 65-7]